MSDIYTTLAKLAEEKKVSPSDLILSGMSPEQAYQFLQQYQPPKGFFKSFVHGLGAGLIDIPLGLAYISQAIPVVGDITKPAIQTLEEAQQKLAPSPEEGLAGKVGHTIGTVASFLTPGLALKALGTVGKLGKVASIARGLEQPVTKYAIPTVIGALGAERAYQEQPAEMPEAERMLRAGTSGLVQAGAIAIPLHRIFGTSITPMAVQQAMHRGMPSTFRTIAKEAGIHAVTFPTITGIMETAHYFGTGEDPVDALAQTIKHKLTSNDTVAEAIAGALLGVPSGLGRQSALRQATQTAQARRRALVEEAPAPIEVPLQELNIGEATTLYDRYTIIRDREENRDVYHLVDKVDNDYAKVYDVKDVYNLIEIKEKAPRVAPVEKPIQPPKESEDIVDTVFNLKPDESTVIYDRFQVARVKVPDAYDPSIVRDKFVVTDLNPSAFDRTGFEASTIDFPANRPDFVLDWIEKRMQAEHEGRFAPKFTEEGQYLLQDRYGRPFVAPSVKTAIPSEKVARKETAPLYRETPLFPEPSKILDAFGRPVVPEYKFERLIQTEPTPREVTLEKPFKETPAKELIVERPELPTQEVKAEEVTPTKTKKKTKKKSPVEELLEAEKIPEVVIPAEKEVTPPEVKTAEGRVTPELRTPETEEVIPLEGIELKDVEKILKERPDIALVDLNKAVKPDTTLKTKRTSKQAETPVTVDVDTLPSYIPEDVASAIDTINKVNVNATTKKDDITLGEIKFSTLSKNVLVRGMLNKYIDRLTNELRLEIARGVEKLLGEPPLVSPEQVSREIETYGTVGKHLKDIESTPPTSFYEYGFGAFEEVGRNIKAKINNYLKTGVPPKNIPEEVMDTLVTIDKLIQSDEGRARLAEIFKDNKEALVQFFTNVAKANITLKSILTDIVGVPKKESIPTFRSDLRDTADRLIKELNNIKGRIKENTKFYTEVNTKDYKTKLRKEENRLEDLKATKKFFEEAYDIYYQINDVIQKAPEPKDAINEVKTIIDNFTEKYPEQKSAIDKLFGAFYDVKKLKDAEITSPLDQINNALMKVSRAIELQKEIVNLKSPAEVKEEVNKLMATKDSLIKDLTEMLTTFEKHPNFMDAVYAKKIRDVLSGEIPEKKLNALVNKIAKEKEYEKIEVPEKTQPRETAEETMFQKFAKMVGQFPRVYFEKFKDFVDLLTYTPPKVGKSYITAFERWRVVDENGKVYPNEKAFFDDYEKVNNTVKDFLKKDILNIDKVLDTAFDFIKAFNLGAKPTKEHVQSVLDKFNQIRTYTQNQTSALFSSVSFIPKDLKVMEKLVEKIDSKREEVEEILKQDKAGYLVITLPNVPSVSATMFKEASSYLHKPKILSSLKQAIGQLSASERDFFIRNEVFLIADASTFFKTKNLLEAVRKVDKESFIDINNKFIRKIKGELTIKEDLINFYENLSRSRITSTELQKFFDNYGTTDIITIFAIRVFDTMLDYNKALDYITRKYLKTGEPTDKVLEATGINIEEAKNLLDRAFNGDRDALQKLSAYTENYIFGKNFEPLADALEKAVRKREINVLRKGETEVERLLRQADFRSVYDDIKRDNSLLKDFDTFVEFTKETVARALGDVDIYFTGDASDAIKLMEYKYGSRLTGFAIKMADRNKLGLLLDNIGSTKEGIITVGHEIYHLVEPNIPEADKKLLYAKFKDTEKIAEAFGEYVYGKYNPPSVFKRIFDSMRDLWDKIVNLFRGAGFTSTRDIFDRIEAGKYKDKKPSEIPTAYFVDAMELAKNLDTFNQAEWDMAFRIKAEEAENTVRNLLSKASETWETIRNITTGQSAEDYPASLKSHNIFKHLYGRGRDLFMHAIRHPVLVSILDKAKTAQRIVHDVVMPPYEIVRNQLHTLEKTDKALFEAIRQALIRSDEQGQYFVNLPEVLRKINPNLTESQISMAQQVYDNIKTFTDRVYITMMKEGFMKSYKIIDGQLNFDKTSGNMSESKASALGNTMALFAGRIVDKLFRFYDYTIENGRRVVVGEDYRANVKEYVEEFIDGLITAINNPVLTETYGTVINNFIRRHGVEPSLERRIQMLDELSYSPELNATDKKYLQLGISLMNIVNKSKDTLMEMDNGFYFPRVRGNGDYEIRVFERVQAKDSEGNEIPDVYYYVETEYIDSKREHSSLRQKEEIRKKLDLLTKKYGAKVYDTAEVYALNIPFDTYIKNKTEQSGEAPEVVILSGRKAPKSKSIIYQHSPSELLSFLSNLALRSNNYDLTKEIREELPQVLSRMYAEINYATARKLHRRRLPTEVGKSAIGGYETENILNTLDEYAIRMQGHLTNTVFLSDVLGLMNTPQFRETAITNPEIKDIVDKQISLIMSPNTRLADFVYKLRAFTAFNYIGLRISTAMLNYMNLFSTFIPEYIDLKTAPSYHEATKRLAYGIEDVMSNISKGRYYEPVSRNQLDTFTKYPEALKDIMKGFKEVERFVNWKVKTKDIFGKETEVPVLDRWNMNVNIEPVKEMLDKAIERGDTREINKLSRDYFILENLRNLIADQTIESNLYNTLRLEGMHLFGKTLNKLFDGAFFLFKNTERHARTGSAITILNALYERLSDGGKNPEKALSAIEDTSQLVSRVIDATFFRYDRLNRYWWTNPSRGIGAILSMPTTLRGFLTNFFSTYFSWFERGQWDKVVASLVPMFLLGGIASLPAVDDIMSAIEKITGKPVKLKAYKQTKDLFGEDFARTVIKGIPSFMVDLSSSLKVEAPFIPRSLDFEGFSELFFGVHRDMFKRIFEKGLPELFHGEYLTALTYLAPMGIGMPVQSYLLTTEGLKTKYGKQIADIETGQPFKLTTEEALLRGLGFRPIRLAEIQDMRHYGTQISKRFESIRNRIYRDFRDVKDAEEFKELIDRIIEFNRQVMEYKGAISPITSESLKRAMSPTKDNALLISRNLLE